MNNLFLFTDFITHDHGVVYLIHFALVCVIILVLARLASRKMTMVPHALQNIFEMYIEGVISIGKDTMGSKEQAIKYLPLVGTLGLVILFSNLIGVIPGFESPSSSLNLTLPLALIVFFYYHYEGIRTQGIAHYLAHFFGPVKAIAPIMFIVEIISHLSRIVSLSFRLFGNIKGDDLFLAVLLFLVPYFVPMASYFILVFMAFLQTFVFMILTYVYLAGATEVSKEH